MEKFKVLQGVAAALPLVNVDTDMIMPARFLKTISRLGLGKSVFYGMRFDDAGNEKPEFILNKDAYRNAKILITGANFGCGSSREHAPWGLLDYGIRCVIAPSFADIFFNNCSKNGILCVTLPQEEIDKLTLKALEGNTAGGTFTVDLENKTIIAPDGGSTSFDVEATRRHNLLNGLDDIGLSLQQGAAIESFEAKQKREQPWLYA